MISLRDLLTAPPETRKNYSIELSAQLPGALLCRWGLCSAAGDSALPEDPRLGSDLPDSVFKGLAILNAASTFWRSSRDVQAMASAQALSILFVPTPCCFALLARDNTASSTVWGRELFLTES